MNTVKGADSATPQVDHYEGKEVWGVYVAGDTPHVWAHEEVAELGAHGVTKVLPIVVPPQDVDWWTVNGGYAVLEALVRDAIEWGVPTGSPICLDIEEAQAEKMPNKSEVAHGWAIATRTHGLEPWSYGSHTWLEADIWSLKWLASWPENVPAEAELTVMPEGFSGWQYAGNQDGIDLDVFDGDLAYMAPDRTVVAKLDPTTGTGTESSAVPPATDGTAEASAVAEEHDPTAAEQTIASEAADEATKDESAIDAQVTEVRDDEKAGHVQAALDKVGEIETHIAELKDNLGRLL